MNHRRSMRPYCYEVTCWDCLGTGAPTRQHDGGAFYTGFGWCAVTGAQGHRPLVTLVIPQRTAVVSNAWQKMGFFKLFFVCWWRMMNIYVHSWQRLLKTLEAVSRRSTNRFHQSPQWRHLILTHQVNWARCRASWPQCIHMYCIVNVYYIFCNIIYVYQIYMSMFVSLSISISTSIVFEWWIVLFFW